ncbi:c-type cytochrome [Algiphilus sp.]|uniref:c-type cytochrome n=1 Tax=Algiphilus sp. TaxID=1872431 RepID=UPI0032ECBC12
MSAANDQQFMGTALGVMGALVVITVLIIAAANVIGGDDSEGLRPGEVEKVQQRIQPLATVATDESQLPQPKAEEAASRGLDLSAAEVYDLACGACHNAGTLNAPKMGDADEWQARLDEKGMDTLVSHAINGFNQMPARGGNSDLSDDNVRDAVEYMLEESGV